MEYIAVYGFGPCYLSESVIYLFSDEIYGFQGHSLLLYCKKTITESQFNVPWNNVVAFLNAANVDKLMNMFLHLLILCLFAYVFLYNTGQ